MSHSLKKEFTYKFVLRTLQNKYRRTQLAQNPIVTLSRPFSNERSFRKSNSTFRNKYHSVKIFFFWGENPPHDAHCSSFLKIIKVLSEFHFFY